MFLLANVVDDVSMNISHVVRAEEHLPNTPKQQLIWQALGHEPPVWAHVPVLVNEARKKLSKRRDKVALEMYRDEGYLADAMVNYLMTLGWAPKGGQEIQPWAQMQADFRLEDVNHSSAFFDLKKLGNFNGDYIRQLSPTEFLEASRPWLFAADAPFPADRFDEAVFLAMAPFIQQRSITLADAPGVIDFLFRAEPNMDDAAWQKAISTPEGPAVLRDTIAAFEAVADWTTDVLKTTFEAVAKDLGFDKPGKVQASVRIAITGRKDGPPLFESLEHLGRAETLRRLRNAGSTIG
jgi:glutamyl-tRNA synthetase